MMTQPASATSALPCVDIHFDDLVLAGALPALVAGAHETPAHAADAAIFGLAPARPPLSDEEDEEAPQDAADDDEDDERTRTKKTRMRTTTKTKTTTKTRTTKKKKTMMKKTRMRTTTMTRRKRKKKKTDAGFRHATTNPRPVATRSVRTSRPEPGDNAPARVAILSRRGPAVSPLPLIPRRNPCKFRVAHVIEPARNRVVRNAEPLEHARAELKARLDRFQRDFDGAELEQA